MSLNMNGERLLAEALADAMNRDLEEIPSQEELKKEHHFSGSFEREMRRLEKQTAHGTAYETKTAESGKVTAYPTKRWRRYGAWAAAFVCVVGLAAVAATGGLFHTGATKESPSADTAASGQEYADSAANEAADEAIDEGVDDTAVEAWDEVVDDSSAAETAGDDATSDTKAAAPDWQEQLLAESAKADEWLSWSYEQMCDDGSIILDTTINDNLIEETGIRQLRVSEICDVYYEQTDGTWTRVYHATDRQMDIFHAGEQEGRNYFLSDLNMTQSGMYRLVRQVNQYRQVLQLSVEAQ